MYICKKEDMGLTDSKYNSEIHPKLGWSLAKLGMIDEDIAREIGITKRTLDNWKNRHPEFKNALDVGKRDIDELVKNELLRNALGYEIPADKVFVYKGKVVKADGVKRIPGDTTAQIFWLKNRRPDEWRDVKQIENDGKLEVITDKSDDELNRLFNEFINTKNKDVNEGAGKVNSAGSED